MDPLYQGFLVVSVIAGLVELARRLGLGAAYIAPLALGLGLPISLAYTAVGGLPGGEALANVILRGLMLGLSAAGLVGCRRDDRGATEERR